MEVERSELLSWLKPEKASLKDRLKTIAGSSKTKLQNIKEKLVGSSSSKTLINLSTCDVIDAHVDIDLHPFLPHPPLTATDLLSLSARALPELLPFVIPSFFSHLDAVTLARCGGVNRAWRAASLDPWLWQRFCVMEEFNFGPGIEAILERCGGNKALWWKEIYREGAVVARNWKKGKYELRTFQPVELRDSITCFQLDSDKLVLGTRRHKLSMYYHSSIPEWNPKPVLSLTVPVATEHDAESTNPAAVPLGPRSPDVSFSGSHETPILCVSMSGDNLDGNGNLVASGDQRGTLALWNVHTGDEVFKVEKDHVRGISAVLISPDNRRIVTAGFDRMIHVYEVVSEDDDYEEFEIETELRSGKDPLIPKDTGVALCRKSKGKTPALTAEVLERKKSIDEASPMRSIPSTKMIWGEGGPSLNLKYKWKRSNKNNIPTNFQRRDSGGHHENEDFLPKRIGQKLKQHLERIRKRRGDGERGKVSDHGIPGESNATNSSGKRIKLKLKTQCRGHKGDVYCLASVAGGELFVSGSLDHSVKVQII
ncbi:hypothetical protein HK102_003055 [Quaeritorhiza haematococci]|nr:hypothetical protein HK102_003055 [Quaeritorhiza haematococci]